MTDARLEILLSAKDISAKGFSAFKRSISSVTGAVFSLQGALTGLGVAFSGREIFNVGRDLKRLENSFIAITGSTEAMGREFDFVRDLADRMGQNFYALIPAYKGIAAASKGTALQGAATRDVFEGLVKASAELGLSSDETSGALTAVSQIISKGKVSAEELRQQLGERLPGAFNLAAKAVGVTTAELDKLLSTGKLTAEEFIPKFARVLKEQYSGNVDDATRAVNKWEEAWQDMKNQLANNGFLDTVVRSMTDITERVKSDEFQDGIKSFAEALGDAAKSGVELVKWLGTIDKDTWINLGALAGGAKLGGAQGIGAAIGVKGTLNQQRALFGWAESFGSEENQIERQIAAARARAQRNLDDINGWRGQLFGTDNYQQQYENEIRKIDELTSKLKNIRGAGPRLSGSQVPDDIYGVSPVVAPLPFSLPAPPPAEDLLKTQDMLDGIDRELQRFFGEVDDIAAGVNDELARAFDDLDIEQAELGIDLELDTFYADLDAAQAKMEASYNDMLKLSQRTAEAIEQNFSDYFFDVFTGQLKDMGDYWEALLLSMKRIAADIFGQIAKEAIFGDASGNGGINLVGLFTKVAGLFGGGSSGISGGSGYYESAADFAFAGGGYLGEEVRGVGVRSGSSYQFHPDEFVLPMSKMGSGGTGGGGDTYNIYVDNNYSSIDSRGMEQVLRQHQAAVADSVMDSLETRRSQRNRMRSLS